MIFFSRLFIYNFRLHMIFSYLFSPSFLSKHWKNEVSILMCFMFTFTCMVVATCLPQSNHDSARFKDFIKFFRNWILMYTIFVARKTIDVTSTFNTKKYLGAFLVRYLFLPNLLIGGYFCSRLNLLSGRNLQWRQWYQCIVMSGIFFVYRCKANRCNGAIGAQMFKYYPFSWPVTFSS